MKKIILLIVVFSFVDMYAQLWQKIEMNFPPGDTLLSNSSIAFATKNTGWIFTSGYTDTNMPPSQYSTKILKTTDGGKNWFTQKHVSNNFYPHELFTKDSLHCWAYNPNGHLLLTTDGGLNWKDYFIAGTPTVYPYTFYVIYFFNNEDGIAINLVRPWFTNDGGKSWKMGDSNKIHLTPSDISFTDKNKGWIVSAGTPYATDGGYIANTTNGGKTWKYQDSITLKMLAVDFIDPLRGFAVGTNWNNSTGFVYSTTNGGENWHTTQFLKWGDFWDIRFLDDKNGWISGDGKILNTADGGNTWEIQVQDLQSVMRKLIVLKKERVVYAFGDYFYRPPFTLLFADLSDITDIRENKETLPKEFRLMQNYPNPFNPTTVISYSLPVAEKVVLKIYDILGREITELVNEFKEAGVYSVTFDASSLSSGIYFYRIEAGKFSQAKKLILAK